MHSQKRRANLLRKPKGGNIARSYQSIIICNQCGVHRLSQFDCAINCYVIKNVHIGAFREGFGNLTVNYLRNVCQCQAVVA